jgi:two-component system phosphate regulon sensor histidine kinase PhoR
MHDGHPRRVVWLLALVTLVPMAVLAWLGLRTLAADRIAERQREAEMLAVAAGRLALEIDGTFRRIEDRLAAGEGIRLSPAGLVVAGGDPLLYTHPSLRLTSPPPPEVARVELAEYRHSDLVGAAEAYRVLARSDDPAVRATALLGLGRVLRRAGDTQSALDAYAELGTTGVQEVAGQPAALVARLARLRVLEMAGRPADLRQEAVAFASQLYAGGWAIDRTAFEEFRVSIVGAGGPAPRAEAVARTEAALSLWREWQRVDPTPRGRRLLRSGDRAVLALWVGSPGGTTVWLGSIEEVHRSWHALLARHPLTVSLESVEGQRLVGEPLPGGVALMPSETRLPFVLRATATEVTSSTSRGPSRATTLLSVLATAFVLMLAAGYGISRTTYRELSLARQQTDFVSAVSHEFRTPLTSMRHLLDLLSSRPVTEERRTHYYGLLTHETERLQRMVETLLTFGRVEAGAHTWSFQPVQTRTLLSSVLEEFGREPLAAGRSITTDVGADCDVVVADPEALSRAVWNLLENSAKYSAPGTPIRVVVTRAGKALHLDVTDEGVGIDPKDQQRIFGKFHRGDSATQSGIRGVGIGLALVRLIAEGHGGTVRVESAPGRGSTFTLVLPVAGKGNT